jgi:hypothetical protein
LYKLYLPGHPTPRQPPATLRLSYSLCAPGATWLYKLHLPGHPMGHALAATSHSLPVLLTMHLELPRCTNFIYLAIPCPCSHQPPFVCPAHYAPRAICLYKLHLLVHSTPRQPPATIRLSCSQCTWSLPAFTWPSHVPAATSRLPKLRDVTQVVSPS